MSSLKTVIYHRDDLNWVNLSCFENTRVTFVTRLMWFTSTQVLLRSLRLWKLMCVQDVAGSIRGSLCVLVDLRWLNPAFQGCCESGSDEDQWTLREFSISILNFVDVLISVLLASNNIGPIRCVHVLVFIKVSPLAVWCSAPRWTVRRCSVSHVGGFQNEQRRQK